MHFFSFAEKDATLYEGSATQSRNTGLDEILEVRKDMNDSGTVINVSRALIKFDLTEIQEKKNERETLIEERKRQRDSIRDARKAEYEARRAKLLEERQRRKDSILEAREKAKEERENGGQ